MRRLRSRTSDKHRPRARSRSRGHQGHRPICPCLYRWEAPSAPWGASDTRRHGCRECSAELRGHRLHNGTFTFSRGKSIARWLGAREVHLPYHRRRRSRSGFRAGTATSMRVRSRVLDRRARDSRRRRKERSSEAKARFLARAAMSSIVKGCRLRRFTSGPDSWPRASRRGGTRGRHLSSAT